MSRVASSGDQSTKPKAVAMTGQQSEPCGKLCGCIVSGAMIRPARIKAKAGQGLDGVQGSSEPRVQSSSKVVIVHNRGFVTAPVACMHMWACTTHALLAHA